MKDIFFLVIVAAGILGWDYAAGGILPDDVYCALGAGYTSDVPSRVTSWRLDPLSGRSTPDERSAAYRVCVHQTLWDAYRFKLTRAGYLKADSATH
jgi:hypothetical protein